MNFTKIYVQRKKHANPPPTAYNTTRDWTKVLIQDRVKYRWLKSERLTPAQEVAIRAKKANLPGPGKYNPKDTVSVKSVFKCTG